MSDDLLAHVAPLGWEHITFNGDYVWPTEHAEKMGLGDPVPSRCFGASAT
jgi:hypothetical protein